MPAGLFIAVGFLAVAVTVNLLDRIPEATLRKTKFIKFHPEKYHGEPFTHHFFEGWYYKLVGLPGEEGALSMAVVPGIFRGNTSDSPESHAFIFVTVNGERQHYFKFPVEDFESATTGDPEFFIRIGANYFSETGISLNLIPKETDDASLTLTGNVTFHNPSPWPVSFWNLGAMGPVGWMPGLECSHGILSFDHTLEGALKLDGVSQSLTGGRGYTEKDHGRSFPSLWIWIQTNSFPKNPGTSLFVSVARIPTPFFGMEFPGFTSAVWHNQTLIPFATYSGAKFEALQITDSEVYIAMKGGDYRVELTVDRNVPHALLYAPVNFTQMAPHVLEALQAKVHMKLYKGNTLLVDDVGEHAGLEVHQNVEYLVDNLCGKPTANKILCL